MKAIGIDIGTTSISTVVMDLDLDQVIASRTVENGSFIHTGNEWERIQNVSIIIEKTKKVLDELLEQYPETERIGLTGQMHGILYVDQEGKCISPLYTWQDGRGELREFEEPSRQHFTEHQNHKITLTEWIHACLGEKRLPDMAM